MRWNLLACLTLLLGSGAVQGRDDATPKLYLWGGFALSPDDKMVAIAVEDDAPANSLYSAFVLSLDDGHLINEFPIESSRAVAFSPDSRTLFVGQDRSDQGLRRFDLATKQELPTLDKDLYPIVSLALSPDGHYLATADEMGVKILDLPSGKRVFDKHVEPSDPQTGHAFGYFDLAFTPDNKLLFGRDLGQYLRWNWQANKEYYHDDPNTYSSALRPDGKVIAYCLTKGIELHSTADDKLLQVIPFPPYYSNTSWDLAYSPDSKLLAITYGKIFLYDPAKKTQTVFYDGVAWGGAGDTHFTVDGKRLVTTLGKAKHSYNIAVWDIATRKLLRTFPVPAPTRKETQASR